MNDMGKRGSPLRPSAEPGRPVLVESAGTAADSGTADRPAVSAAGAAASRPFFRAVAAAAAAGAFAALLPVSAAAFPAAPTAGKTIVIKIGSVAPPETPWGKALERLSLAWARISNGGVELKVLTGGIVADETDMLRKLRIGTLDGAVFTNFGMTKVNPNLFVLNAPFLIGTKEEFDLLFRKMEPAFVKPIEEKGFKVLLGTLGGWVYVFSKDKCVYPVDLKKEKISFTTGEPEMEQAFKRMGYRVIPNEMKDTLMSLQSGMATAVYYPALLAASAQFFVKVPNMLPLPISVLVGWLVLTDGAWEAIPEAWREPMAEAALAAADGLYAKTQDLEKEAIRVMVENGLKVTELPADAPGKWRAAALDAMNEVVGKTYPREIFDEALGLLRELRGKGLP